MAWIKIEDQKADLQNLKQLNLSSSTSKGIIDFVESWEAGRKSFEFQTSGSTGKPKLIKISRTQMEHSAQMTIETLGLKPNSTSLLCMNPSFIGGKMMIVRSLINQMNLVVLEPSSNPLKDLDESIDFAALVPLQLANAFGDNKSLSRLKDISSIIVGGGEISTPLRQRVSSLNNAIYSTYGMTETVSHIALQLLSRQSTETYFTAIKGVEINIDDRDCLTIKSAVTNNRIITTNDRVELVTDNKFKWLGRIDNVINSGGIKVQIEMVEASISKIFNALQLKNRFILKGAPDNALGQKVVLLVEGDLDQDIYKTLATAFKSELNKYEKPKEIVLVEKFEETPTGKILRNSDLVSKSKVVI